MVARMVASFRDVLRPDTTSTRSRMHRIYPLLHLLPSLCNRNFSLSRSLARSLARSLSSSPWSGSARRGASAGHCTRACHWESTRGGSSTRGTHNSPTHYSLTHFSLTHYSLNPLFTLSLFTHSRPRAKSPAQVPEKRVQEPPVQPWCKDEGLFVLQPNTHSQSSSSGRTLTLSPGRTHSPSLSIEGCTGDPRAGLVQGQPA